MESVGLSSLIGMANAGPGPQEGQAEKGGRGFADVLQSSVEKVNDAQLQADEAVGKLHSGEAKNIHEVTIALEQADISLRLMVKMRNKAMDAYQEIMRMQV
ncbi:MAG TPA: flagellar hook-basal body complex protein FliE [Desulfomicrobiaceae bacterium]|jgi:flagellar hook-basal body complex protein FliE|nr:flagellar hook-basal body complex protein FliE [Desulfomicrobiaceae bacterium]